MMGFAYARNSLISIVAIYGKNGLTKEQIINIGKKFTTAHIEEHWGIFNPEKSPLTNSYINKKEDKYFPVKSSLSDDYLQKTIQKFKKESKNKNNPKR